MKISIITVCFNSEATIRDTIESVLAQNYTNIEYIIIDGQSTDNTLSIIKEYKGDIAQCVSEPDLGIYDAMNKGIVLATGDVIGILNSDDFYPHKDVISQVVSVFHDSRDASVVVGNVSFVLPNNLDKPTRLYSSFRFKPWMMRFGFSPAHPATFIKKIIYEKVGCYKCDYKIAADFEWFVRAFLVNDLDCSKLNETLVIMREGGVSTSGLNSYFASSKEQLRALLDNGVYSNMFFVYLRLPIKLLHKLIRKP